MAEYDYEQRGEPGDVDGTVPVGFGALGHGAGVRDWRGERHAYRMPGNVLEADE